MKDTVMKDYGEDVFSEKAIRAFLPKTVAAKLLQIDRKTLYNKMHLYGIEL